MPLEKLDVKMLVAPYLSSWSTIAREVKD